MSLFLFSQATIVYSLPVTNHYLFIVESSNDSFRQRKYGNTSIRNTNDIIIALDNIDNQVSANDS